MEAFPQPFGEADAGELQQLRRCLRDMVSLAALPASWTGKGTEEIASLAAEVLLATLRLDVACISLHGGTDKPSFHVRLSGSEDHGLPAEDLNRQLADHLQGAAVNTPMALPNPAGEGALQALVLPIGRQGQFGFALAASHLPHFPNPFDRVLLEVCANQTAIALKEAHLIEELRESNAALQRSNDDLAQYAYAASHDLQEPMRTVIVYSQLIDRRYKGQLDDAADELIMQVVNSAKRMERLIRDLLSHSRLSGENETAIMAPVDTAGVTRAALLDLREAVAETNAAVTTGELPLVSGNASQLRELFQNLLGNAIKYHSPERPPRIHIEAAKQDAEWLFSIKDNGEGFDQRYAETIFGIFARLHGQEVSGTGIGLAICRKVVERHGGRIWAESRAGEGSTFYFTLPETAAVGEPA